MRIFPILVLLTLASTITRAAAQEGAAEDTGAATEAAPASSSPTVESMTKEGVTILLEMQEGETKGEWPYEGVYRYDPAEIPVGYRCGGTAIAAQALLQIPGYAEDPARKEAVRRALDFVLQILSHPLMKVGFRGEYDVRGWGHAYALLFLLELQRQGAVPEGMAEKVKKTSEHLVSALEELAIPKAGGWNYALRSGFGKEDNQASPFMTGPSLQALFMAKSAGIMVKPKIIDEALDALERARGDDGGYAYSSPLEPASKEGRTNRGMMNGKPGSVGRMCVAEATLALAGRGDQKRLQDAVDSFFAHHDELKKRKQQRGTHIPPYGVAPYYFMYSHYYCAQAIELLADATKKEEARKKLFDTLVAEREKDGGWNDRVFPRSRNYGTALGTMAILMKDLPPPLPLDRQ